MLDGQFTSFQMCWFSILLGFGLGLMYDIVTLPCVITKCSLWIVNVKDIIYFFVAGVCTFLFLLAVNFGQLRYFILCGEFVGWLLCHLTIGRVLLYLFQKVKGLILLFCYSEKRKSISKT